MFDGAVICKKRPQKFGYSFLCLLQDVDLCSCGFGYLEQHKRIDLIQMKRQITEN